MIRPFIKSDFDNLAVQDRQRLDCVGWDKQVLDLAERSFSWTWEEEGKVLAFGGLIEVTLNRAIAWMFLSELKPQQLLLLTRHILKFMEASPYNRIEASARKSFVQASRWLTLLGFDMETACAKKYFPDGEDAILFARVR